MRYKKLVVEGNNIDWLFFIDQEGAANIALVSTEELIAITNDTKKLNVTVNCMAVYNSSIEVPADMCLEEAITYAKENLDKIPLGEMEYISDSDELDEENCYLEECKVKAVMSNNEEKLITYIQQSSNWCPFNEDCGIDFENACVGYREKGCKECIFSNLDKLLQN